MMFSYKSTKKLLLLAVFAVSAIATVGIAFTINQNNENLIDGIFNVFSDNDGFNPFGDTPGHQPTALGEDNIFNLFGDTPGHQPTIFGDTPGHQPT